MFKSLRNWWCRKPKRPKVGLFASSFDPAPLSCHVLGLQEALDAGACDQIVVAVHVDPGQADPTERVYAGLSDRLTCVRALRQVHSVFMYRSEDELYELLVRIRPDVRLRDDEAPEHYTGDDLGIPVFICRAFNARQRTELIRAIRRDIPWCY